MNLQSVKDALNSRPGKNALLTIVSELERQDYDVLVAERYHGSKELIQSPIGLTHLIASHRVRLTLRGISARQDFDLFVFLPGSDLLASNITYDFEIPPEWVDDFSAASWDPILNPSLVLRVLSRDDSSQLMRIKPASLEKNVAMLDSCMGQILAWMSLYAINPEAEHDCASLLFKLNQQNPLAFEMKYGHPFYDYKFKRFLLACITNDLSMGTWDGNNASQRFILFFQGENITAFDVYQDKQLVDFVLQHTQFVPQQLDNSKREKFSGGQDFNHFSLGVRLTYS